MGEATNTTTKFIDHIGGKNNTARLIELGTLLTNLNNKKNQLEKVITTSSLEPEELNGKIEEFNNIADEINKSIKERSGLTNKESLIKPVQKKERVKIEPVVSTQTINEPVKPATIILNNPIEESKIINEQKKEEHLTVPNNTPEQKIIIKQNERGEPTRVTSGDNLVEDSVVGKNNAHVEEEKEQNTPVIENSKTETEELPVNQSNTELRKQLYEEMQKVMEIEKQLAKLEEEDKELEKFITEQEELEKLEQLKKKALEAIRAGKKAGLTKKDLLAKGFNAGDIDEVFNSKKK